MPPAVTIQAPSSKSLSHRALVAASLAAGVSELHNILESEDLARTRGVLEACGASICPEGAGSWRVTGLNGAPRSRQDAVLSCFMGESGTSCRLLTAVLAAGEGRFRVHGAGRLHERPMGDLLAALTELGASIRCEGKAGCPPLLLEAKGLSASALPEQTARVCCEESSQYLSGLLLAAPLGQGLRILLDGDEVASWPYVALTLQIMEDFGIPVTVECRQGELWTETPWRSLAHALPGATRFIVNAAPYRPTALRLEGDYSSASYFLAAGALGPTEVTVQGLRENSLQGDAAILELLSRMGARIVRRGDAVTASPAPLSGIDADMGNCPDLVPTVAVLAGMAVGVTRIRRVAHLRGKESDRLLAPAVELRKIGCRVDIREDGLDIAPPPSAPTGLAALSCHNDHRMAMSLALLERRDALTLQLDAPGCVAKSFPQFWTLWRRVCPKTRMARENAS